MKKGSFCPLTEDQLRALPTKRLLAYLDRIRKVHDTPSWEDDGYPRKSHHIYTKDDPRWGEHFALVKRIASDREHVR